METRSQWLAWMQQIAEPVVRAAAEGTLWQVLPMEFHGKRAQYFAPLEAFGRTACGIAPWLAAKGLAPEEEAMRSQWAQWMREGIDKATDLSAPSAFDFSGKHGGQPLVDAAFLCHALVRAPEALAAPLTPEVRGQLVKCLKMTREIQPGQNNWILFSAMVEAGLFLLGDGDVRLETVLYSLEKFALWYKGDGVYGDGEAFHWDYYNSFVIHPMMVDVVRTFAHEPKVQQHTEAVMRRAERQAQILERLIAPDGTYPVIGRSIVYRFGAFQLLSQAALQGFLPEAVKPAQVRCALTAVMQRTMGAEGMFDKDGWLAPGVYGLQSSLAEEYINVGSLYLCMAAFLPLGLPADAPFWAAPDAKWTSVRVWSGEDLPADHAIQN